MKKVLQPLHKPIIKPKALSQNLRNDAQNSLDWTLYRKRHCLSKKTKIFICKGYGSFKRALFERGWHENTDFNSPVFHLKFVVKRDHIFSRSFKPNICSYDGVGGELQDFQIVNHFSNNNLLTSKVGLCASLKNLVLWTNESMDNFFPKCFTISKSQGDLTSPFQHDLEEFNEEFRFVYSSSVLKKYVAQASTKEEDYWQHQIPKILVALNICEKRLLTIDEQIEQFGECTGDLVSDTEWRILELNKKTMTKAKLKEINEKRWYQILKSQYIQLFVEEDKLKNKEKLNLNTKYPLLFEFTKKVLNKLQKHFTQFNLNGDQNLWIVKPGHQSRGRGIVVLNNYNEILKYIRESSGRNWVVQKYIENPLIINKKKFDIR